MGLIKKGIRLALELLNDIFMIRIVKAKINDAKRIVSVAKSVLLENLPNKKGGFLMSDEKWLKRNGVAFYENIIKRSSYCYAAKNKEELVGFLIAFPREQMFPEDDIQKKLIEIFSGNYIYIFQIAVKPEFQGMSIGGRLYEKLFKDSRKTKKVVATSYKPYNKASEKFHLNLGFNKLGKFQREDRGWSFYYDKI